MKRVWCWRLQVVILSVCPVMIFPAVTLAQSRPATRPGTEPAAFSAGVDDQLIEQAARPPARPSVAGSEDRVSATRPASGELVAGQVPLRGSDQARALAVLGKLSLSDDPFIRSNVIEAVLVNPEVAGAYVRSGLLDRAAAVRFAAAVGCGKLRLDGTRERLERLMSDPDASVRAAAMYALKRQGVPVDLSPMAVILFSNDPGAVANTAMLLGLLGDASAVPMLRAAAAGPMGQASAQRAALVRIQLAEAMARLGDQQVLDVLRAGIYNRQYGDVRIESINAEGRLKDRTMIGALENLMRQPPLEIQLAAAGALAQMGHQTGLALALGGCESDQPLIRAQSCWVLGYLDSPAARRRLAACLSDSSEHVRAAASAGTLRQQARSTETQK